jgi:uncharacterized protein YggT (Ycf19 family)
MNVISRIIWFISAIVIGLLLLRFFFILFGANVTNDFVRFVYDVTRPLVSPFFGLFNYMYVSGKSVVEIPCLVAIVVYTVVAALLVQLFSFGRRTWLG